MIQTFGNGLARDLVEKRASQDVRRFPKELARKARMKLALVHAAKAIADLRLPPGNHLERLKGKERDFYSIRVNDQWRVVFRFVDGNAYDVSVEDYHR